MGSALSQPNTTLVTPFNQPEGEKSFSTKLNSFKNRLLNGKSNEDVDRTLSFKIQTKNNHLSTAGDIHTTNEFAWSPSSPSARMRRSVSQKSMSDYVMLRVPETKGGSTSAKAGDWKFQTKVVPRQELVKAVEKNAKANNKRPGNVKLALDFLDQDKVSLMLSKGEIEKLTQFFKSHVTPPSQEMSKETFLETFAHVMSDETAIGAMNDQTLEQRTLQTLFESLDVDKTGVLTLSQFLIGFSHWRQTIANSEDRLSFVFQMFDLDKSGKLNLTEFIDFVEYFLLVDLSSVGRSLSNTKDVQTFLNVCIDEVAVEGYISEAEVCDWVLDNESSSIIRNIGITAESLENCFKLFDYFGSGLVSVNLFRTMIKSTHLYNVSSKHRDALRDQIREHATAVFNEVTQSKPEEGEIVEEEEEESGETSLNLISCEQFQKWAESNKRFGNMILNHTGAFTEIAYQIQKSAIEL